MTPKEARAVYAAGEEATVQALCQQREDVLSLRAQVEALVRLVAQLEKDSSTSHKPPPSDIVPATDVYTCASAKRKRSSFEKNHKCMVIRDQDYITGAKRAPDEKS